jgi:hypothetical protein
MCTARGGPHRRARAGARLSCAGCQRLLHPLCLTPPALTAADLPGARWACPCCGEANLVRRAARKRSCGPAGAPRALPAGAAPLLCRFCAGALAWPPSTHQAAGRRLRSGVRWAALGVERFRVG